MFTRRQASRFSLSALTVLAFAAITGCGMMSQPSNMVAFSTQLRGANEVPPVASAGSGSVDAAFNKDTNLLRWKVNYTGLSGPATAGHFHGPAAANARAAVAVPIRVPLSSPMEGQIILNPAQAADLLAGKWYLDIHTLAFPGGEIRGQVTLRE